MRMKQLFTKKNIELLMKAYLSNAEVVYEPDETCSEIVNISYEEDRNIIWFEDRFENK